MEVGIYIYIYIATDHRFNLSSPPISGFGCHASIPPPLFCQTPFDLCSGTRIPRVLFHELLFSNLLDDNRITEERVLQLVNKRYTTKERLKRIFLKIRLFRFSVFFFFFSLIKISKLERWKISTGLGRITSHVYRKKHFYKRDELYEKTNIDHNILPIKIRLTLDPHYNFTFRPRHFWTRSRGQTWPPHEKRSRYYVIEEGEKNNDPTDDHPVSFIIPINERR